jgi:hypothetical protein
MWPEKLISTLKFGVSEEEVGGGGLRMGTNLDEESTCKACPNEEKVWRVWHVPNGMHIVQPQIEQREGSFHALRCAPPRSK